MSSKPSTSKSSTTDSVHLQEVRNSMNVASANKISKFIAKPEPFRGDKRDHANPMVWLNSLERIYNGLNFTDEEMIIVLASYFSGPALVWWNVIEPRVKTWENFVVEFTNQYASSSQKDTWWEELENLSQGQHQTIDDIKFRVMELSTLLGVPDSAKIRYFMRAIDKTIAMRVADVNPTLTNWEEVTNSAKRIEMNNDKYGNRNGGNDVERNNEERTELVKRYKNSASVNAGGKLDDNASVASLNSIASTMERLCRGFDTLQLALNTASNSGSVHSANHVRIVEPTNMVQNRPERHCYNCQEAGHIATYCPHPRIPRNTQPNYGANNTLSQSVTPAIGVNAIPIGAPINDNGQGKAQGRQ